MAPLYAIIPSTARDINMISDGTLIRYTDKWNKLLLDIQAGNDLENTITNSYRMLRSAYAHLNTEYIESEIKRNEFSTYLHAFVETLVTCPVKQASWAFCEDRQLSLIILIAGIKAHDVWLDEFMNPRDVYSSMANKNLPPTIEKLPVALQKKWHDKIRDLIFNSKRNNEHYAYLGKDTHAFLMTFKKTIFSHWEDYTDAQRMYLWCATLGSIHDDIELEKFIMSAECNRDAIDETIEYFKQMLPENEYSNLSLITNLYLKDKVISIELIDRLYEQIEKTTLSDNDSNYGISLEF